MGADGTRKNQVRVEIEQEILGRDSWNQKEFEGWHGNLMQWKLPQLYKGDLSRGFQ